MTKVSETNLHPSISSSMTPLLIHSAALSGDCVSKLSHTSPKQRLSIARWRASPFHPKLSVSANSPVLLWVKNELGHTHNHRAENSRSYRAVSRSPQGMAVGTVVRCCRDDKVRTRGTFGMMKMGPILTHHQYSKQRVAVTHPPARGLGR